MGLDMLIKGTLWILKIVGEVAFVLGMIAFFATVLGHGGWLNLPSGYLINFLIFLFGATLACSSIMLQRRI